MALEIIIYYILALFAEFGLEYNLQQSRLYSVGKLSTPDPTAPWGCWASTTSTVNLAPTPTVTTRGVTSVCSCLCNSAAINRPTSKEEESVIAQDHKDQVKGALVLDTKNLTAVVSKKESAKDERPSSTYMGLVGIFMLSFVFGSMIAFDVPRLISFLKSLKSN